MALTEQEKEQLLEELEQRIKKPVSIPIYICKEGVELPFYATDGDAGMDVRAVEDIEILPGDTKLVPTGLKFILPAGYEVQIRPRSGLSTKTKLRIPNSPGTLDSSYRGELFIPLENISLLGSTNVYTVEEKENHNGIYQIKRGDRIAQLVFSKFETVSLESVDESFLIEHSTKRGLGFGSSGMK